MVLADNEVGERPGRLNFVVAEARMQPVATTKLKADDGAHAKGDRVGGAAARCRRRLQSCRSVEGVGGAAGRRGSNMHESEARGTAGAGMPRRTALTLLGLGAAGAGMGLVGCGDGSSDGSAGGSAAVDGAAAAGAAGGGASTTTRLIPAYDPNRPYWVQGNFAPVSTE
jgi:hypothetical protein